MSEIKDKYGRQFQSLRVSLTNACNMKCVYCVPEGEVFKSTQGLDYKSLARIVVELQHQLSLTEIRITGGEPTIHPNFSDFINLLAEENIKNIKLTTNGLSLEKHFDVIFNGSISEINFSLDSLNEDTFLKITKKKDLDKVLNNIDICVNKGIKVKINTVPLKDANDNEILDLVEYFMNRNIPIRFLELMRMGHLYSSDFEKYFVGQEFILETISEKYNIKSLGRSQSATAQYWQMENGYKFGIIANESVPFCNDCNRLRIDSKGRLYGCLSKNDFVDISKNFNSSDQLTESLQLALLHKQALKFKGSELSMMEIGG